MSGAACGPSRRDAAPKLIVLGVDGMDPNFVERHWDVLPNLSKLRHKGYFSRLGTTTPPQSPVAWSTFITGLEPAEHGIFDFVHRNATTLQPFSSLSQNAEPRWSLPIGPYLFPLSSSRVISLRHGTPFWELLSEHGIPVTVVRMPTNYPPIEKGYALAGMGAPDLNGTLGTFSFFTDEPAELSHSVPGGRIIKVRLDNGRALLPLDGPPNPLRRDHANTFVNLIADVDPDRPVARLRIDDQSVVLRQGEWSDWITADFSLIAHVSSVRGMIRFYAKQLHPRLELYVSAINIDPVDPALPIAAPPNWGRDIARENGRFFTLGTPEDTAVLRQHLFTLDEFRQQAKLVFEEERSLLRYSLKHFHDGLLFFYFSAIDQNSHILWRRYEPQLLAVYQAVDESVGETMRQFPEAQIVVLSDHGFTTFERAVHLNTWLKNRGFLSLAAQPSDQTSLDSVDWSSTEAYAIGLNGLYLNRKTREEHGIVPDGEPSRALITSLKEQLLAWRDPVNNRQVVEAISEEKPAARNAAVAPDLIVGYSPGYRASWQTALGGAPPSEIEDNDDAWIGDHCIDPAAVPGVLFTSAKISPRDRQIQDVTALVMNFFKAAPGQSPKSKL